MSYQPVIPASGNLGWSFLKSSRAEQQKAFDNSTSIETNADYFREKIGSITSAKELVSDRRLLSVALGAFGLDDDIDNKFFVRKVLEEGTLDSEAFANRLSDKRYFAMAEAFSFHLQPPNTALSDFPEGILAQYRTRQFEVAVGNQDENLRLALGLSRDIEELAQRNLAEETAWFTIMGNPPMRRVFEKALGLPSQLAAIDLDQQLGEFRAKAQSMFGTSDPADFTDEVLQEKLIRNFLVRSELQNAAFGSSGGTVALTLLQSLVQT
jgi:hypothetical protein